MSPPEKPPNHDDHHDDDPTAVHPESALRGGGRDRRSRAARAPVPTRKLRGGERFAGRFAIDRVIGSGGMGLVYSAIDEQTGRRVAIKVLPAGSDDVLEARFRREARLISELRHPNVVELVDFGHAEDLLYLAMELIEGDSLTVLLHREGALGYQRAVAIALQIAHALLAAHAQNVVHRDIKPDNIMICRGPDGRDLVKVLDFGVAKIKREAGALDVTVQTQAGKIVGSLRYISPEQVQNGEITTRTDMYLFGCVLYELLTGRRVFEHRSPAECAIAHAVQEPRPPEVPGMKLPRALVDFTMRCLAKAPETRPADARAAVIALAPLVA